MPGILTAIPQSDRKRPKGRPHTFWLATMKNDLSYHNLSVKMPPSWHRTDPSGGYWQQAEICSFMHWIGASRTMMMIMNFCTFL